MIKNMPYIILVVGNGRAGTNFLGKTIKSHPEIIGTIEPPVIFQIVSAMALDKRKRKYLFPLLKSYYSFARLLVKPKHYMDKSHPNLWILKELMGELPNIKVIGIIRDPYQSIASMVQHKGIKKWFSNWEKYPIPNYFLGINETNLSEYENISLIAKCALRWKSHNNKMLEMKKLFSSNMHIIKYDNLVINTQHELKILQQFIGLTAAFHVPKVNKNTLDKWKNILSSENVKIIDDIIE